MLQVGILFEKGQGGLKLYHVICNKISKKSDSKWLAFYSFPVKKSCLISAEVKYLKDIHHFSV